MFSAPRFVVGRLPRRRALQPRQRRTQSGINKVAENKIAEWLHNKGDEGLSKRGALPSDRHRGLARALGVHDDYVHSKILADNNVRPASVERRMELEAAWEELRPDIREAYESGGFDSVDAFVRDEATIDRFGEEVDRLDRMAKKVNDAIISDSMRFNGRCPVRHARRFAFEDRLREAVEDADGASS